MLADGPTYGYAIAQAITERSEGAMEIKPGNLYRVLDRLIARGFVASAAPPDGAEEEERRQYFRITEEGRRVAREELLLFARVIRKSEGLSIL